MSNGTDRQAMRTAGRRVAIVAGLFVAVVSAGLAKQWFATRGFEVQDSKKLAAMKRQLAELPDDSGLKERIRRTDLAIRQRHAERLRFLRFGGVLLVCGLVVLVASLRVGGMVRDGEPTIPSGTERPSSRTTAATLAVAGLIFGVTLAVLGWPTQRETTGGAESVGLSLNLRWGRFRGPGGLGRYAEPVTLPTDHEEGIVWRTRVPLPGKGSAVAWGNAVYVCGADNRRRAIYAFDAINGQSLWTADAPALPGRDDTDLRVLPDTGYAAATCCTDGQRVYSIFANGDLVAVDAASGEILWAKALGIPANQYGLAASLAMAGGKLLVPFDQTFLESSESESNGLSQSKLMALDPSTGEVVWERRRDVPDSWTTPLVTGFAGREQIITAASPWVIAYGLGGAELWRVRCLSGDVAPSPVPAGGRVCVTNTGVGLFAINPTGSGDVTETAIAWKQLQGPWPDIISPAGTERYVLTLTTEGLLRCFDATDGREVWRRELEGRYYASPTVVGSQQDELLLLSESGRFVKLRLGERYDRAGEWSLGEDCYASPAFGAGRMFVRARYHLYCVGVGG